MLMSDGQMCLYEREYPKKRIIMTKRLIENKDKDNEESRYKSKTIAEQRNGQVDGIVVTR